MSSVDSIESLTHIHSQYGIRKKSKKQENKTQKKIKSNCVKRKAHSSLKKWD